MTGGPAPMVGVFVAGFAVGLVLCAFVLAASAGTSPAGWVMNGAAAAIAVANFAYWIRAAGRRST